MQDLQSILQVEPGTVVENSGAEESRWTQSLDGKNWAVETQRGLRVTKLVRESDEVKVQLLAK